MISEHMKKFAGLPVREWAAGVDWSEWPGGPDGQTDEHSRPKLPPLRNPEKTAYRIGLDYEAADSGVPWSAPFSWFLTQKGVERVAGVVVGMWGETGHGHSSDAVLQPLTGAAEKLPNLRAVFLGDIVTEENEVSWIQQSDVGPLLAAYPKLEHLGVRGSNGLQFQTPGHKRLKSLIVQTGGLPRTVLHQILQADWPALEHLELWLGTANYGADTTVEDLAPILAGTKFRKLKYLGLRDSAMANDVAAVLADAPVLKKVEVLDLSMGTLSDEGVKALLAGKGLKGAKKLKKLDIHHHYCSDAVVKQLKKVQRAKGAGYSVDATEAEGEDTDVEDRYVAVGE